MIRGVVFDMDGVLLDSERLYRKYWLQTAKEYGIPEEKMNHICNRIAGGSASHTKEVFAEELGIQFPYAEMRERVLEVMTADIQTHGIEKKEGISELLEFLKQRNIRIGLATSTEEVRAVENLKRAGIYQYFDGCMFGDKVKNSKPAPDIYIAACERIGLEPQQAMGVEDSINGIYACINAGMTAVMVIDLIQPTENIRKQADYIYTSAYQIIEHWEEF